MTERKLRCPVCNDITAHAIKDGKGFKLMYAGLTQGPWVVRECEECGMQTVVVYGGTDYIELGNKDNDSDVRKLENQTPSFFWVEPPEYEETQKTGIDSPSNVGRTEQQDQPDRNLEAQAWRKFYGRI